MEYSDLMVDDVEPAQETPRPPDPSLLAEALIKARKLREFISENYTGDASASNALIRDYNGLRALVVEASPRLVATLPPELPVSTIDEALGSGPDRVTCGELVCFCEQIKDFLKRRQSADLSPRVDAGRSLFGPDGLKHDPALLAAARAKAQSILDYIKKQVDDGWGVWRTPATVLEDYNQLLALIREAAPESASALPREITMPVDPKPRPVDEPDPSMASRLFSFLNRDRRPKTLTYGEFLYHCQQIARLLK